jgi:hypothetical protein
MKQPTRTLEQRRSEASPDQVGSLVQMDLLFAFLIDKEGFLDLASPFETTHPYTQQSNTLVRCG